MLPIAPSTGPATERGASGSGLGGAMTHLSLPTLGTVVVVVAILYFGREVFLPLAIALLLTFALAPVVSAFRRAGAPRLVAVISSVLIAFSVLAVFSFILVVQVGELARNIPLYQANILTKISTLKEKGAASGIVERLQGVVEQVGREIDEEPAKPAPAAAPAAEPSREPIPVEVITRQRPIEVLRSLIAPLVGPLTKSGLVVVVVIFMLLEREELRDRFIRLVGYGDLHRTTQALQDAGSRVARYLLMQLVVNVTYAIPITIGLWVIGIPNAILWGLLALALRFVPYIGPIVAMLLPLFLAVAVDPGWSLLLWTAALFLVVELISNNVVEPWLYGSRTGLSPLAVIVAAIFWTWLWGPLGLVLSTPLTVCLVVLGRHVPQFAFLDVLLGNEPVLEPEARLYQRLLAGDPDEATDHAEEMLAEKYLVEFYEEVAIPALLIAERDRARGVLGDEQRRQVAASAFTLLANLEMIAQEEAEEEEDDEEEGDRATEEPDEDDSVGNAELPDGEGRRILCIGGRGELDDAAAAMLAQLLEVQGADALRASFADLEPARLRNLPLDVDTVVIGFLNADSLRHARIMIRRFKRAGSALRVGIVLWSDDATASASRQAASSVAAELGADFVAYGMADAVRGALADEPPVPPRLIPRRSIRAPVRRPPSDERPVTAGAATAS